MKPTEHCPCVVSWCFLPGVACRTPCVPSYFPCRSNKQNPMWVFTFPLISPPGLTSRILCFLSCFPTSVTSRTPYFLSSYFSYKPTVASGTSWLIHLHVGCLISCFHCKSSQQNPVSLPPFKFSLHNSMSSFLFKFSLHTPYLLLSPASLANRTPMSSRVFFPLQV